MTAAIDELIDAGTPTPEAIERFIAENDFPIQEGTASTFCYYGPADRVSLKHWIYGLGTSLPFERVGDSDLWYLTLELPAGSRVEYKLRVTSGPSHPLIRDPLNPARARDPFGANSVCYGLGYEPPEWIAEDPESRPGALERLLVPSRSFGDKRPVEIYLPARFRRSRTYPLLVVHDGHDYLRYAAFKEILDNLIERLEIAPLVVALTRSPRRLDDYAASSTHAEFLRDELVPLLEDRLPLEASPEGRGLMGASFGAVAALSTAWRYPGFFGRLLLQSGSFAFTDIGPNRRGPAFEPIVDFMNSFRKAPARVSDRLYVSCGMYESLIYENRSLIPLLQSAGMEVRYTEARDGHNWENWRDRLREGLSYLFPGPLWMVYE